MTVQVAIVEDDIDFRTALGKVVAGNPWMALAGSYASAEDFLEHFPKIKPDVVLMDIHMSRLSGTECVRQTKVLNPDIQYIMCTVYEEEDKLFESLEAGASGYILKKTPPQEIIAAILEVHAGGSPMTASIARKVVDSFKTRVQKNKVKDEKLSARENEILDLLSKGYRYKEIAGKLFISLDTVRTHVRNIYEKLQVNSRMEAINKVLGR